MILNEIFFPRRVISGHTALCRFSLDSEEEEIISIFLDFFDRRKRFLTQIKAEDFTELTNIKVDINTNLIDIVYVENVVYFHLKIRTNNKKEFVFPESDFWSMDIYAETT